MSTVLVTGGSGFLGSHIILQLLEAGHVVRTTVRSLDRETGVRAMLEGAGTKPGGQLSCCAAPRPREDAIIATAERLVKFGIVSSPAA